jgi:hypothetical protein
VGCFVHRDGEQHGQGVDENGLNEVGNVHALIVSDWRALAHPWAVKMMLQEGA